MAELLVPQKDFTIESGQKFKIPAQVINAIKDWERKLIWSQENGHIDPTTGLFSAPAVKTDQTFVVKVQRVVDKTTAPTEINVTVKKAEEKQAACQAANFEIREHGADGNYRLSIQVTDQNGKGLSSAIIISDDSGKSSILPGGADVLTQPTDNNGYLSIKLTRFKDKQRDIQIEVCGTALNRRIYLLGPRQPKPQVKHLCGQGFMKNFMQKPIRRRAK